MGLPFFALNWHGITQMSYQFLIRALREDLVTSFYCTFTHIYRSVLCLLTTLSLATCALAGFRHTSRFVLNGKIVTPSDCRYYMYSK